MPVIACLLTLLGVGLLMFIGQSMAAGGGGGENDMHLEIHIKADLESQALLVGGLILWLPMIVTEVVERTPRRTCGLAAVLALNYYPRRPR